MRTCKNCDPTCVFFLFAPFRINYFIDPFNLGMRYLFLLVIFRCSKTFLFRKASSFLTRLWSLRFLYIIKLLWLDIDF